MSLRQLISAKDFVQDTRSGMTDAALIEKYNLSPNRLQRIFKKLLDAKAMTADEVAGRCASFDDPIQQGMQAARLLFRHVVDFVLPIYEEKNPEILGMVLNVTEGGVGLKGIEATIGESKRFVIPADEFFDVARLRFQARCRWVHRETPTGEYLSGFEVTSISTGDLVELKKLIQLILVVNMAETSEYSEQSTEVTDRRERTRYTIGFRLPIHEATNRDNKGVIVDIDEGGIGIKGMEAKPDERKTLVIPSYHGFVVFDSIVMIAECRWADLGEESGERRCGFEVLQLTARNSMELSKLLATLIPQQAK